MSNRNYVVEDDNRPFYARYPFMTEEQKQRARKAIEESIKRTKHKFNQNEKHDLRKVQ